MGRLGNQSGASIMEVLIMAAAGLIVIGALMTSTLHQEQEMRSLSEKMASLEVQRTTMMLLNSPTECDKIFDSSNLVVSGSTTFDSTAIGPTSPRKILLKAVSPNPLAPKADGQPATPLARTLALSQYTQTASGAEIEISSMTPPVATLNLHYDQNKLVRAIAEPKFNLNLAMSGPANATVITGCGTSTPAGSVPGNWQCKIPSAGGKPMCIDTTDGHFCNIGFSGTWVCTAPLPGWPGPADWQCDLNLSVNSWSCIRPSTGQVCNSSTNTFVCYTDPLR